jgi:hypothetical protein
MAYGHGSCSGLVQSLKRVYRNNASNAREDTVATASVRAVRAGQDLAASTALIAVATSVSTSAPASALAVKPPSPRTHAVAAQERTHAGSAKGWYATSSTTAAAPQNPYTSASPRLVPRDEQDRDEDDRTAAWLRPAATSGVAATARAPTPSGTEDHPAHQGRRKPTAATASPVATPGCTARDLQATIGAASATVAARARTPDGRAASGGWYTREPSSAETPAGHRHDNDRRHAHHGRGVNRRATALCPRSLSAGAGTRAIVVLAPSRRDPCFPKPSAGQPGRPVVEAFLGSVTA